MAQIGYPLTMVHHYTIGHEEARELTGIISSVGIPNPPAWPYLLAVALLPVDSPYAVVGLGIAVTAGLLDRSAPTPSTVVAGSTPPAQAALTARPERVGSPVRPHDVGSVRPGT